MGKSKFYGGLVKGSTKSTTYSTLPTQKDGRVQIVKDRVTEVANPRTTGQMITRMAMATASKAAAAMAELIGISFEGAKRVAFSKQMFQGANTSRLAEIQKGNVPGTVFYPRKDFSVLVPNSYMVSKGSLVAPPQVIVADNDTHVLKERPQTITVDAGQEYTAIDIIRTLFNCEAGDQLTWVDIIDGEAVVADEASLQILRSGEMSSARIVFKGEEALSAITPVDFSATGTAAAVQSALRAAILAAIDLAKSYGRMAEYYQQDYFTVAKEGDLYTITGSPANVATATGRTVNSIADYLHGAEIERVKAGTIFRSHWNGSNWKFSSSWLAHVLPVISQQTYDEMDYANYGMTYEVALVSYLTNKASASDRYTQAGGGKDSINLPSFN